MSEQFFIILLAGLSCAGKSTIGFSLCKLYGFNFINQQTIVHDLATSKGYPRARYWLAEVGVKRFVKDSIDENIRRIRALVESKGIVLDAVYSREILLTLKCTFPQAKLAIVSVIADSRLRESRMMNRLGAPREEALEELKFRDDFLTQAGVRNVIAEAHITVDNSGEIDNTVSQICDGLSLIDFPSINK